jgi:hypothetical protein
MQTKEIFRKYFSVVFQFFNGWLDACMNYIYRISWDTGAIWIVGECHKAQMNISVSEHIYGIGNVKLETMCLDSLIERTFNRKYLRH